MEEFGSVGLLALFTHPVTTQVFGVVLVTVVANYLLRKFFRTLKGRASKTHTVWDDALVASIQRPAVLLIWILGVAFAAEVVSAETNSSLSQMIDPCL
jgi:MscS family membrane protein